MACITVPSPPQILRVQGFSPKAPKKKIFPLYLHKLSLFQIKSIQTQLSQLRTMCLLMFPKETTWQDRALLEPERSNPCS